MGDFREISAFPLRVCKTLSHLPLLHVPISSALLHVCVTPLGLVLNEDGGNKNRGRRRRLLWLRNVPDRENMAIKGSHFHPTAVMSSLNYFLLPSPFTDAAISPSFSGSIYKYSFLACWCIHETCGSIYKTLLLSKSSSIL